MALDETGDQILSLKDFLGLVSGTVSALCILYQ
jgi:hypothetical protein